jgi:hypothetical protein
MGFNLKYGSSRTPRWGYTWLDWRNLFIVIGLIAFLPTCFGLILNSPYVLVGTGLFTASGVILGRCFPWRLRQGLIISAILAAATTVTLYLISSYQLVVENQSGQSVKRIQIICEAGPISALGFGGTVPTNGKLSATFHALRFNGEVTVEGTFADGTTFKSTPSWNTPQSYRLTRIVINSNHEAVITRR